MIYCLPCQKKQDNTVSMSEFHYMHDLKCWFCTTCWLDWEIIKNNELQKFLQSKGKEKVA